MGFCLASRLIKYLILQLLASQWEENCNYCLLQRRVRTISSPHGDKVSRHWHLGVPSHCYPFDYFLIDSFNQYFLGILIAK